MTTDDAKKIGHTTHRVLCALIHAMENPTEDVVYISSDQTASQRLARRARMFWKDCPVRFLSAKSPDVARHLKGLNITYDSVFWDHWQGTNPPDAYHEWLAGGWGLPR